jgi:hypothetical protein
VKGRLTFEKARKTKGESFADDLTQSQSPSLLKTCQSFSLTALFIRSPLMRSSGTPLVVNIEEIKRRTVWSIVRTKISKKGQIFKKWVERLNFERHLYGV